MNSNVNLLLLKNGLSEYNWNEKEEKTWKLNWKSNFMMNDIEKKLSLSSYAASYVFH